MKNELGETVETESCERSERDTTRYVSLSGKRYEIAPLIRRSDK
jgi:hypothetical protein